MDNKDRILSLLGLAARARKIVSGEEFVIKGIQSNHLYFILITNDAAENIRKKVIDKCNYYNIPYKVAFNRDELGHAIGKFSRVVVGVKDQGFAKGLKQLFE